jgi:putative FmdB family regulatory protein
MPLYEYKCLKCGYTFDELENVNASRVKACPKCNQTARRVISSSVGFVFKGSGFYATEYKKKSSESEAKKSEEKDKKKENKEK